MNKQDYNFVRSLKERLSLYLNKSKELNFLPSVTEELLEDLSKLDNLFPDNEYNSLNIKASYDVATFYSKKLGGVSCKDIIFVSALKEGDVVNVTMVLNRPGIFIGRGGHLVNELKANLEKTFKGKVEIYIKENMWNYITYDLNYNDGY
jgi:hypothetical protein